ncbi:MAG: hypothetical protein CL424_12400, partial [Acidimicrobiaceae bacterium]|nr:hypothetical protein [Acidimicrobiaceae bacterium]
MFGPGTKLALNDGQERFGYWPDREWSFEIDIPPAGETSAVPTLRISAQNTRGISDPYAVSKVVLSLAAAAGFGVAGAGLGLAFKTAKEASAALAVVLGGAGGALSEGAKLLLKAFTPDDWPECALPVFDAVVPLTLEDLDVYGRTFTIGSDRGLVQREGCKDPEYTVTLSFEPVNPPVGQFGKPQKVASRKYTVVNAPGKATQWKGLWLSAPEVVPTVSVWISPSPADANAPAGPQRYSVRIDERIRNEDGSTYEVLAGAEFDFLEPVSRGDLLYWGTVVLAERKEFAAVPDPNWRRTFELATRVGDQLPEELEIAGAGLVAEAAPLLASTTSEARLIHTLDSGQALADAWYGRLRPPEDEDGVVTITPVDRARLP